MPAWKAPAAPQAPSTSSACLPAPIPAKSQIKQRAINGTHSCLCLLLIIIIVHYGTNAWQCCHLPCLLQLQGAQQWSYCSPTLAWGQLFFLRLYAPCLRIKERSLTLQCPNTCQCFIAQPDARCKQSALPPSVFLYLSTIPFSIGLLASCVSVCSWVLQALLLQRIGP